jgi:hypothetical protein
VQLERGAGEVAVAGDRLEIAELADVHRSRRIISNPDLSILTFVLRRWIGGPTMPP